MRGRFSGVVLLLLPLLQLFIRLVIAVSPTIGIQRDWLNMEDGLNSYSGIIRFNDDTKDAEGRYPPQTMSPEKFLRLVVIAHDEMVTIHASKTLASHRRPGAMIGLAYQDRIFFASSMKNGYEAFYDTSDGGLVHSKFKDLITSAITNCQRIGEQPHRLNLACGEPSSLDLWLSTNPEDPVANTSKLRMIDWLTYDGVLANRKNSGPCGIGLIQGWGCYQLLKALDVQAYKGLTPDAGDGSEWAGKFEKFINPRLPQ